MLNILILQLSHLPNYFKIQPLMTKSKNSHHPKHYVNLKVLCTAVKLYVMAVNEGIFNTIEMYRHCCFLTLVYYMLTIGVHYILKYTRCLTGSKVKVFFVVLIK